MSTAPTELLQAGIECLGVDDSLAADAEVLGLARGALEQAGAGDVTMNLGDVALFPALLSDLAIDDIWARRLAYAFRHPSLLRPTLDDLRAGRAALRQDASRSTLQRRQRPPPSASCARSLDLVRMKPAVGRSVDEIAAHLIDKAKAARAPLPGKAELDLIESFLAIAGRPMKRLAQLKRL